MGNQLVSLYRLLLLLHHQTTIRQLTEMFYNKLYKQYDNKYIYIPFTMPHFNRAIFFITTVTYEQKKIFYWLPVLFVCRNGYCPDACADQGQCSR